MSDEKPTASGGESISERIEKLISAGDSKAEAPEGKPAPQEAKEVEAPEVEAPAGDDEAEDEGPQFNLSDVAKVLGVDESFLDVDEDGSLKVKTKIDGQEGAAKFHELLKSYQLQGHIDNRAREAAERSKALEAEVQQFRSFAVNKSQELQALANAAQQMFMADVAKVNWDDLAQNDPITYVAKQHEFNNRKAEVGRLLGSVQSQLEELGRADHHYQQQTLQAESQRLSTLVPEWKDEGVREKEKAELAQWLFSRGASVQSVGGLTDAGMVAALLAGMRAERNAPKVSIAEKKVRAAPKLVKPGQSSTAGDRRAESIKGLKEQIRKTGGKQGIAEYLMATGKV